MSESADKLTVLGNLRTLFAGMAQSSLGLQTERPFSSPPQPMVVLGAGFGRTGTSSLVIALRRLGLNTYHMREGVVESPGHGELWAKWVDAHNNNNPIAIQAATEALVEIMARDGFNATSDFPACLLTAELFQRYPNARVVVGVRASGGAWADSVLSSIARFRPILSVPPWPWVRPVRNFLKLDKFIWSRIGASVDPSTGSPRRAELAAAHDTWIADVKRMIPQDQLLIHQPKDGWGPLCAFVSPASPAIRSACDGILASNEAYPHVNDTPLMQRVQLAIKAITLACWLAPLLALYLLVRARVRRGGRRRQEPEPPMEPASAPPPNQPRSGLRSSSSSSSTLPSSVVQGGRAPEEERRGQRGKKED
jgi:hypothetical protein